MAPTRDRYQPEVIHWVDPEPPKPRTEGRPIEHNECTSRTWLLVLAVVLLFPALAWALIVAAIDIITRPFHVPGPSREAMERALRRLQHA